MYQVYMYHKYVQTVVSSRLNRFSIGQPLSDSSMFGTYSILNEKDVWQKVWFSFE